MLPKADDSFSLTVLLLIITLFCGVSTGLLALMMCIVIKKLGNDYWSKQISLRLLEQLSLCKGVDLFFAYITGVFEKYYFYFIWNIYRFFIMKNYTYFLITSFSLLLHTVLYLRFCSTIWKSLEFLRTTEFGLYV